MKQSIVADWQQQLSTAVTDTQELLTLLNLSHADLGVDGVVLSQFPLRVPRNFVARMEAGNPDDPLLRQVLPSNTELVAAPGYTCDPLGESGVTPVPGLLHKYHGRVLLVLSGGCAINCRYCFRRHFPYEAHVLSKSRLKVCLDYIESDPSIEEIILSGGEPLLVKDEALSDLVKELANVSHVKRLRLHTRMPIVIPARITTALLRGLTATRLSCVLVLHANHANELDEGVRAACLMMREQGVTLLNQAVLLQGVNDDGVVLVNLSERLFECGVMPYYLHSLDKVQGAAHFAVEEDRGRVLMRYLQEQLPGYLVPRFVKEVAGERHKVVV